MYLLFDIGGTNTRLAVSPDGSSINEAKTIPTPRDFQEGMNTITSLARQMNNEMPFQAIAGGIAGPLDKDKSMITTAPNLKNWNYQPLKHFLTEKLNAPVYLENDTTMAGISEARAGAGKGYRIVAYITVSTGIGGSRIIDGMPDHNSLGFEPGHQIISAEKPVCACGGAGHLEGLVSGTALFKKYKKPADEITDPAIWDEMAFWLARGLNNTIVHWSPDVVVLGGSLMKSLSIEKVQKHLEAITTIFPQLPPLKLAALDSSGGLIGSLLSLNQKHPLP